MHVANVNSFEVQWWIDDLYCTLFPFFPFEHFIYKILGGGNQPNKKKDHSLNEKSWRK